MGRGRAKAKQQKVARELKYSSPDTDLAALQRELSESPESGENDEAREDERDDGVTERTRDSSRTRDTSARG